MVGDSKNIAASVHQRLLNNARASSRPFNEILQQFAIERFMYRLSKGPYAQKFILKGALMFSAWTGSMSRPTMDIDLLGKIDNSLDMMVAVVEDTCEIEVESDGIVFHKDTVRFVCIDRFRSYDLSCSAVRLANFFNRLLQNLRGSFLWSLKLPSRPFNTFSSRP